MLTLLSGFDDNTVAVRVSGVISAEDYAVVLLPAIESKLRDHVLIKLWYEYGADFEGISLQALWDDLCLGLFHLQDFSRIAVITDSVATEGMARTMALMIPCPVAVFPRDEMVRGRAWLSGT
ncbi:STAS/SEC14 domain-containing protein [Shewanella carassii]|uniref:Alpha-L-fucosidase n=1 Tax=Shewanella carassii TaxID=1987584 RepID=A0ABQ1SVD2_9GAMM|nr:STAS/SEC14 domain-containing protein [Shewanella carassii]GGE63943.1 alpha-L-fucosidase [Shewanella carassii]